MYRSISLYLGIKLDQNERSVRSITGNRMIFTQEEENKIYHQVIN